MKKVFPINGTSKWSLLFKEKGADSLFQALRYVRALKYERISDAQKLELVLEEERGTCSAKHGVVALLAEAEGWQEVELWNVLYKMNEQNTPGVGRVLEGCGLEYLPEAHTILKIKGMVADITGLPSGSSSAMDAIICEERISVEQLIHQKVDWHQREMKEWIEKETCDISFTELWQIRERCIAVLSS
ncbi:MAG: hypothetical protein ACI84C_002469 [Flavobacteriales bacterium]|jgi:hypothetical protein